MCWGGGGGGGGCLKSIFFSGTLKKKRGGGSKIYIFPSALEKGVYTAQSLPITLT